MRTEARGKASRGLKSGRHVEDASQREDAIPRARANDAEAPSLVSGQIPPSSPAIPPSDAPIPAGQASALGRFLMGFVYAGRGLLYALRTQRNVRVHAVLAAAAIALGIALRLSAVEWALVVVAITSVFVTEMINTVVEACVDLVTREYHPLARVAKDVAAGAVLLNAILSVVVALLVYVPHLWPLLLRWLGR